MTDLPADGESMVASINFALKDAQLPPKSIGYINAHGSSTKQNDIFETNAYKRVFGNKAYDIPISSLKSMIKTSSGFAGVHSSMILSRWNSP